MHMKPFGINGSTYEWGFTLPLLLGHLEGLAESEADNVGRSTRGGKALRLEKVENAISLLDEAMNMGNEDNES